MTRVARAALATLIVVGGIPAASWAASASATASMSPQDSGSALAEDLRYARELAARFQFLDLAEAVIARVSAQPLGSAEQEALALTQAQVYGEGARFESDPDRRRDLFHQALDAYQAFLEKHPLSPHGQEARRSYVNLGATYGWLLEQELAEASGERAQALEAQATERLSQIAAYTGEAIDAYGPPSGLDELQKRELAQLLLARGQLLLQMGRLSEDGTFFLETGSQALRELIFTMGGETGWALNAFVLLAEIELVRGDVDSALANVEYVIEQTIPMDRAAWDRLVTEYQLTRADKDARWQFVELATPLALRCARRLDDQAQAMQYALHFYNTRAREGFNLTPRGYSSVLDVARALIDNGGVLGGSAAEGKLSWYPSTEDAASAGHGVRNVRSATELALSLATTVNEDNPRSYLQTQAQRVIAEAIAVPGVTVSTEVLYQAALGEFNAGNWEAAVPAFKRVLASATSPAERTAWGGKVYLHVGRSLQRMDRTLEAAMAFEEGARRYRQDEEAAAACAQEFYRAIGAVRRGTPGDPTIEALWLEAERIAADVGTADSGDIFFRQGERAAADGNHAQARELFSQVPPESRRFEQAKVRAAVALYAQGKRDEARAELVDYVENYVNDPRNRLGPQDATRISARDAARAEAEYNIGRIDADESRWEAVAARFSTYKDRYPTQTELRAAALDLAATAELESGDVEAARGYLERLQEEHPGNARTINVATRLYNAVFARFQAAEAAGDSEAATTLRRRMAELLSISNEINSDPAYSALRDEGLFWLAAGDAEKAERALRRFMSNYGDREELARIRDEQVRPALARALLLQRRAQEAYDTIAEVMPKSDDADAPRPSAAVTESYVRAIAGWIEGEGAEPVIVPGIGGLERLEEARKWQTRLAARSPTWSCEWLADEAQSVWIMIQMGSLDSTKQAEAQRAVGRLRAFLQDDFREVAAKCGGDTSLQRRFQWLSRQVR